MSLRYFPIPYQALDLVPETAIVADLYRRGHRMRWKPWSSTSRSLATSWDCSTDRVWAVLEVLDAAGLLSLTKGARRKPSVIEVRDPQSLEIGPDGLIVPSSQGVSQRVSQRVRQNSSGGTMDIADEQSKDPSRVQSRDQSLLHDHDQDHDRDHEGGVSAKPDEPPPLTLLSPPAKPEGPTDWQRLNTLYASLPGCKSLQSPTKGLGKNLQRMLDVHGLQDAEIMLQWMAYATGCAKADSLSESGHRVLSTVGRAEHVEGYWPHVHRWAALGKKGLPDGRPKRKRFMNGHRPTEVEGYDPYNPGKTR